MELPVNQINGPKTHKNSHSLTTKKRMMISKLHQILQLFYSLKKMVSHVQLNPLIVSFCKSAVVHVEGNARGGKG